jgi:hypothetical protein
MARFVVTKTFQDFQQEIYYSFRPSATTSGPMPSPAITAKLKLFMIYFYPIKLTV